MTGVVVVMASVEVKSKPARLKAKGAAPENRTETRRTKFADPKSTGRSGCATKALGLKWSCVSEGRVSGKGAGVPRWNRVKGKRSAKREGGRVGEDEKYWKLKVGR
jgi:hypothetical protein